MAWDGDWFGSWDGVWFGTTSTPPSSISGSGGGGRLISAIIDQMPQGGWNSFRHDRRRHFSFVNDSSEEVPAYAALEIVSVDSEGTVYVTKPTQDSSNNVLINGPSKVKVGGHGTCTNHLPTWAYCDGAPANGDSIGTRAGYWYLSIGFTGFLVWGGARNGVVFVQRDMNCGGCYCEGDDIPYVTMTLVTSVGTFTFNAGFYNDFYDSPFSPSEYMLVNGLDHEAGWVGSNFFLPRESCEPIDEPDWGYYFTIWVIKCTMQVFVQQVSTRGDGPGPTLGHIREYTDCGDHPDDVIDCDPFHVIKKLDLETPIYTQSGYDPTPLETCSGYAGGCDSEEYLELVELIP